MWNASNVSAVPSGRRAEYRIVTLSQHLHTWGPGIHERTTGSTRSGSPADGTGSAVRFQRIR